MLLNTEGEYTYEWVYHDITGRALLVDVTVSYRVHLRDYLRCRSIPNVVSAAVNSVIDYVAVTGQAMNNKAVCDTVDNVLHNYFSTIEVGDVDVDIVERANF